MAKWMVSAKKADFDKIAKEFNIDPVIARIIRNRDITEETDIRLFLNGTLNDLHNPRLLYDMEKAVAFILSKIEEKATIRIIGDYDIDGICATYILMQGLKACGADVDTVIPHRIKDGYGLNDNLIEEAHNDGIDTIITCDNGIAAAAQVEYANRLGMNVIVTDHHEVPYELTEDGSRIEQLPPAYAVVDPKQEKCAYPFDGICGAVVAYKFIQVLLEEYEKQAGSDIISETDQANVKFGKQQKSSQKLLEELLEFAAFATVGDVMELRNENRIIVSYGLKQMAHTRNLGLRALIEVNGLQEKPLSAYHIAFVLGPCMNATGRLDSAIKALELLSSGDFATAVTIAGELKELNDSRKEMTRQCVERAIELIENGPYKDDKVLVIFLTDCHESLAGIIAGRLKERYHKPVFVLTKGDEGVKGSGRSIEAYHMYEQMSLCKQLFTKYGGHSMAAGLSMIEENVEEFRKTLNRNCNLSDEDFEEKILIDVPMPLSYISLDFVRQLALLEPFGNGNPKPVFAQKNIQVLRGRILGKNANVGKFSIRDEHGKEFDMMYFGDLEKWHGFLDENFSEEEREKLYLSGSREIMISIIYYPDINVYQGRENLQIVMQDYAK
ncbi:MAG: single-stranded-DNA-specific exonuclease RecJ [Lachnospiraceae bacterium]|nr:single-stranded-DNA-specific exonuclease RecJ [Lachnospiraceae bacterium]